jgi:hypothetical protein
MKSLADFEKSDGHEKSCGRHTWPMENHAEREKMAWANKNETELSQKWE